MRRSPFARPAICALLVLVAGGALLAQDVSERRGFRIAITAPESDDILFGRTEIAVDVEARDPKNIVKVEFFVDDELLFTDAEPPYRMLHDFGTKSAVHVIRAVAHHEAGVTVSDFVVTRSLDVRYFVNVQRVVMDVSVRDENKRFVTGLPPEAFSVAENGVEQKVLEVSPEERPITVGILIDSSGSMHERMKEAQAAACEFVKRLKEGDRGFVIDFDEAVYLIQETTDEFERLCSSIRTTRAIGGTALYDAVHAAYRVIHKEPAERRALVILSDGDDTESRIDLERIREESLAAEVTIYAIGLDVGMLSEARKALGTLTEETGGRAYFVNKAEELAETYDLIAKELRSLYQVVWASSNEELDGRFIEVEMSVESDELGRLEPRHRKGYFANP